MTDFAAPAFDQRHGKSVSGGRAGCVEVFPVRRRDELFLEKFSRALNFQPAHPRTGKHIAAGPHRHRHGREAMPASRMIKPNITHQAGSPRGHADQTDLGGLSGGDCAGELKSGAGGIRVPQPFSGLIHFSQRDAEFGEQLRGAFRFQIAFAAAGAFRRYKIVDASFHNWLGLEMAMRGQAISDFPICNKSFNLSYCGVDL